MIGDKLRHMGIQQKLIFLAVVPVLITTIILGYYVTSTRIADVERTIIERGDTLASHLAQAVEFGLFTGNRDLVSGIITQTASEPDIVEIVIYDKKKNVFVQSPVQKKYTTEYTEVNSNSDLILVFDKPVVEAILPFSEFEENLVDITTQTEPATLGWVEVKVSKRNTIERQREILVNGLLIMAAGLLVSAILALRIGGAVAAPIIQLTRTVQLLTKGQFDARIDVQTSGELETLKNGFNSMADTIEKSQAGLKGQVDKATEALRKTVTELEQKNRELETARRQAIDAGKTKTDFLAKMSHEIRTPVNAVVGFAKLLEKSSASDIEKEYARTINQAGYQLSCIIDDILNFSKLESSNVVLEHIPYNLQECVEDVMMMLRPSAHDKNLELVLIVHVDTPVRLFGDPTRMMQIITNLVSNAIKFTSVGSVLVEIQPDSETAQDTRLRLTVSDTGIGISVNESEKLFKAFSQLDSSITRRFGGTGLGLAIVKKLVDLMEGEISLTSEPGKGTEFTILLPAQKQMGVVKNIAMEHLQGKRVRVYESQPLMQRSLRSQFVRWGMQVFVHGNFPALISELSAPGNPETELVVLGLRGDETQPGIMLANITTIREYFSGPILVMRADEQYALPASLKGDNNIRILAKPARAESMARTISEQFEQKGGVSGPSFFNKQNRKLKNFGNARLLVVEDNAFNQILISTLLKQRGIEVVEAHNGQEAIEQFLREDFDAILMDVHMPIMDGIEATEQIRKLHNGGRRLPVIALTADVFLENATEKGFDDVLHKPINENMLWQTLEKWMREKIVEDTTSPYDNAVSGVKEKRADHVNSLVPEHLQQKLKEQVQFHLEEIDVATAQKDREALFQAAHHLLGLVGYYQMTDMLNTVREIEKCAHSGDFDRVHNLVATCRSFAP